MINSINKASQYLDIDPGASGDSAIVFKINSVNKYACGVDDSAADSFKISASSTLGLTDCVIITANGEVTEPLQSSCLAYNSAQDNNVTGDGTVVKIEFDTEIYDLNNDYNNATDAFTASVTGRYLITPQFQISGAVAGLTTSYVDLVTSNRTYQTNVLNPVNCSWAVASAMNVAFQAFADMDSGDTAYVNFAVSGGAKVIDIYGGAFFITSIAVSLVC